MQKIVSFLKKKKEPNSWSNFDRSDDKSKSLSKKGSLYANGNYDGGGSGSGSGGSSSNSSGSSRKINTGGNNRNGGGMVHSPSNSSISSTSSNNSNSTTASSSSKLKGNKNRNSSGKQKNSSSQHQQYGNTYYLDDECDSDDFIPGEVRSISKTIDFSKSERKWLTSLNIPQELLDGNINVLLNVLNFLSKKEGILYIQTPTNIINNTGKKNFQQQQLQQLQQQQQQQQLQQQQHQQHNHQIYGNGNNNNLNVNVNVNGNNNNSNNNNGNYTSYVNSRSNSIASNNSSITPSTSCSNLNNDNNNNNNNNCTDNNSNNNNNNNNNNSTTTTTTITNTNVNMIGASNINSSKSNLNSLLLSGGSNGNGGVDNLSSTTTSLSQNPPIQPMRRSDYNRIFIEPGKFYIFPESESFALARLVVEEEDPSKLFRIGENAEVKGAFGTVYQVFYVNGQYNNVDVALKKMDHKSEKKRRNNLNEISILRYLKHPNIVTYINSYEKNDEEIWMVMEYMDGGTIRDAISNFTFTEKYVAYITKEILHSLEYLASLNIAHRDLKSSNIMINSKAEVKLIDFGFSIDLTHLKQDINMCGSPFYMSPEQIQDKAHGLAVDIWSLGIVVAEMVRGRVPHHKSKIKAMFLAGTVGVKFSKEKKYSCHWSPELFDFLNVCLQMDPTKRPTPTQLLQHPFIATAATKAETLDLLPLLFMSKTLSKLSRGRDNQ
ncbi:hypothetical protein DDB_G0281649 [Dictyostelium discoideum AX4]|uniref:Probable serine/threonine-protein kinase mkcE n=1 Tax=Dictyostelium discoideum TaxID=44689 RepID=MKCE_DICDI|nr:hypothetical protein DDB_G0281649 [Dictyostelium discoideum AX4]Q54TN4.1 RecName: Full=Probable serine/threonine-protein kinase mkcE; AltName: Full=MAP kinase cascade E [Dictyostelium discoideum]EAL66586.1 hypothetical protein DDB_G0281649 [Dictyostelium discoideum AX4]|eukprot:XP_640557.1 hypothetical protein DDB_G0281649 [Dictyostelium discoideum AX4]